MGRVIAWVVGVAVIGPILAFLVGWLIFRVPGPEDLAASQVAEVSYADGSQLARILPGGTVNRTNITLDQVPPAVRHAVMSAEDRSFESNPGFDVFGIARAMWNQLRGGRGGGSTITQQYIKTATGQDEYTLFRKYRELILAAKISQDYSKDQILEGYLNTIYLGRGAYGIQAAAKAYFNEPASKLTVTQGALLAGIIQSPSRWDPAKNPAKATERWTFVLDGMVLQKWLSPTERAQQRFPTTIAPKPVTGGIPADARGHIYTQIKAELESHNITEQQLNTEGLKITTTIRPALQKQAQAVADRIMKAQLPTLRAALVSIDPRTGEILAYYGGENGVGLDYAQVSRQPGSSFKPFVMAAALQQSPPVGLGTTYDGSTPQTIAGQTINNSDGDSCANCSLQTAMTKSINTIFYRLAVQVGPNAVADAAHQAGIPEDLLANPNASIGLGSFNVHPTDMASAYATFANNGVYHAPHMITKVTTADGEVLFDAGNDAGEKRIDPQVARNVTESMINVARGSLIPLAGGRPVAAKTGTTQNAVKGQNQDAWTVGYTPSISTAVWAGNDDNSPIKTPAGRPIYGRMVPGSIWQGFMNAALRNQPSQQFGPFDPLGTPPHSDGDDNGDSSDTEDPDDERDDGDDEAFRRGDDLNGDGICRRLGCDEDGNPLGRRGDRDSDRGRGDNGSGDDEDSRRGGGN